VIRYPRRLLQGGRDSLAIIQLTLIADNDFLIGA
jgi:hypothetical protein